MTTEPHRDRFHYLVTWDDRAKRYAAWILEMDDQIAYGDTPEQALADCRMEHWTYLNEMQPEPYIEIGGAVARECRHTLHKMQSSGLVNQADMMGGARVFTCDICEIDAFDEEDYCDHIRSFVKEREQAH